MYLPRMVLCVEVWRYKKIKVYSESTRLARCCKMRGRESWTRVFVRVSRSYSRSWGLGGLT